VTGSVADRKVRGRLTVRDGGHYLELGPAWFRDNPVAHGAEVSVTLAPEGPQVVSMSADLAEAFNADPDARRFFESLATFYRKGFVRWIEGAKRPDTRARRIAETIAALTAGRRQI
jgi:Bacteriocin-protection, YdeI or OmpD-Associated